jgi:hypothetical protein
MGLAIGMLRPLTENPPFSTGQNTKMGRIIASASHTVLSVSRSASTAARAAHRGARAFS